MDSSKLSPGQQLSNLEAGETSKKDIRSPQRSTRGCDSSFKPECSVFTLPFEILASIFEFYIYGADVNEKQSKGPLRLGAVCQTWRQTAWTTPRLWTTLFLRFEFDTTENQIHLAVEWLNRSGTLPLSITLHDDSVPLQLDAPLAFPLFDCINQSLARCWHLDLSSIPQSLISRFTCRAPSVLTSLKLNSVATSFLGEHIAPTKLDIEYIPMQFFIINWSNLTEFRAFRLDLVEVFYILTIAPQITSFHHLDVVYRGSMTHSAYKMLTHSRMKELSFVFPFDGKGLEILTIFFQNTTLPKLTNCRVHAAIGFPTATFLEFITRSSCSIQDLDIIDRVFTSEDLISIAKALPSITSLTLSPTYESSAPSHRHDSFYNALCQDARFADCAILPEEDILLPSLRFLSITTIHPFPWAKLLGFRHQSSCSDEVTSGLRLDLDHIYIFRTGPSFKDSLIDCWQTFAKFIEFSKYVELELLFIGYEATDYLFELSYRSLEGTVGKAPKDIQDWFQSWSEERPRLMSLDDVYEIEMEERELESL